MLLHTNVVLSSCAAVATDQHGRVTEGGCLRANKKGAGGLAGGLKYVFTRCVFTGFTHGRPQAAAAYDLV